MSRRSALVHEALSRAEVAGGELILAGRPISSIAEEVGRTPFYAYDRAAIARRVETLRAALPKDVDIHYAVKANPMPELVRSMIPLVDGLDIASAGELAVALAEGADPAGLSFAGPGKTDFELKQAVEAGITLHVESPGEMRRLAEIARRHGVRTPVAVRVNPDFELKSSGMKMAGGPKQFGVDAEAVPGMLEELATTGLRFVGFHIFSGSQNLRADSIIEAQRKTLDLAIRLSEHAPGPVRVLNMGGGFGIPYFPGEVSLDVATIGDSLAALLDQGRSALPEAKFVLELGRYLVGESGVYVCRVIDRKVSRGQVFLVTDGGLHHHLAASGNFGQVLRKNFPVVVGNKASAAPREKANVVGPLCTPLDLLADRMELPEAVPGDLIVVLQSGAYGFSASPHGFLSHPPPLEVLL